MAGTRIQLKRGDASEWTDANTVLRAGEVGLEMDTGKFKWGDGTTAWNDLAYIGGGSESVPIPEWYGTLVTPVGYPSYSMLEPFGVNGFGVGITTPPLIVAAASPVVVMSQAPSVQELPTTVDDDFDLSMMLLVTNLDGTQQISIAGSGTVPSGESVGSIALADAEATAVAGDDLTWDPDSGVTTAAGGTFVAAFVFGGSYD